MTSWRCCSSPWPRVPRSRWSSRWGATSPGGPRAVSPRARRRRLPGRDRGDVRDRPPHGLAAQAASVADSPGVDGYSGPSSENGGGHRELDWWGRTVRGGSPSPRLRDADRRGVVDRGGAVRRRRRCDGETAQRWGGRQGVPRRARVGTSGQVPAPARRDPGRDRRASPSPARAPARPSGAISIDPLTGTPRMVGRLDGFLDGPERGARIDRGPRRTSESHAKIFKLSARSMAGLRLVRDYVDVAGTHHLGWTQTLHGVPLFGNGLQASVARDGRLINVTGSPVSDLGDVSTSPSLSAAAGAGSRARRRRRDARDAARQREAGAVPDARRDEARLADGDDVVADAPTCT